MECLIGNLPKQRFSPLVKDTKSHDNMESWKQTKLLFCFLTKRNGPNYSHFQSL